LGCFVVDVGLMASPLKTGVTLLSRFTHRFTARIISVIDSFGSCAIRVQEATVDKPPEREGTSRCCVITTGIHAPGIIPFIAQGLIG
jgi:hypothetical protein